MKGKEEIGAGLDLFAIFENAADGDIGAIVILAVAALFVLRFLTSLLKFVFKQFPALFFGTVAGIALAEEEGVYIDEVIARPERLPELLPYLLPALAVAFVIWNVILLVLRAIFRSVFGKVRHAAQEQHNVSRRAGQRQRAAHRQHIENEVVTASETRATRKRDQMLKDYEQRKARVHQFDEAHGGQSNQPMVVRRRKAGATVVRP